MTFGAEQEPCRIGNPATSPDGSSPSASPARNMRTGQHSAEVRVSAAAVIVQTCDQRAGTLAYPGSCNLKQRKDSFFRRFPPCADTWSESPFIGD